MISFIKPLIVNITILFSLMFNANLFIPFNRNKHIDFKKQTIFGLIGAFAAILCMIYPIETLLDTNFDMRMVAVMIVTLYGGMYSGAITTIIVVMFRFLIGGEFIFEGVLVTVIAYFVAIVLRNQFTQTQNKVLFGIIILFIYYPIYILIISQRVPFLELDFYIVYFFTFTSTFLALIFIIEKLMTANEQIVEAQYYDKLTTVSQMAASFAHEIRNPITTVKGFIQYISADTDDKKLKEFAPLIIDELDRTNKIITDYLQLAKPMSEHKKYVAINKLLHDSVELLRPLGSYRNVTLELIYEEDHVLFCDENHLKQALINVIKNGIESIDEYVGGKVTILKRKSDSSEYIEIIITDNGKGMTVGELSKIGLPYYTTKSKGTGLGSMVTARLIKELDGKLQYESEVQLGTKVIITLPINNEGES